MEHPGDLLIRGGRVIDPAQGIDGPGDVLIRNGRIAAVGATGPIDPAIPILDARGSVVAPGLIDMHVHLREPGNEEEETIASGARAAAAGGLTAVACMPNTLPAIDNEAQAEFVLLQAQRAGFSRVFPIGAITRGRKGEALAEMGGLARAGAVAFSDDGVSVKNPEILRRALLYSKMFGLPVIEHAEDADLAGSGVMNQGLVAMTLGLSGKPNAAEDVAVARDITLAEITGARLHIAHVSTEGAVDLVRRAKKRGIAPITCEACPHHFSLTDERVRTFDTRYKVNPPLRTERDVDAVRAGIADGTIDAIASDHAPHAAEEKALEWNDAPDGMIGVETLFAVAYTTLVKRHRVIGLERLIEMMARRPAEILRLPHGTLTPGAPGDVTVLDPEAAWTVDASRFHSKSRNCPFDGWELTGRAVATVVAGRVVHRLEPAPLVGAGAGR